MLHTPDKSMLQHPPWSSSLNTYPFYNIIRRTGRTSENRLHIFCQSHFSVQQQLRSCRIPPATRIKSFARLKPSKACQINRIKTVPQEDSSLMSLKITHLNQLWRPHWVSPMVNPKARHNKLLQNVCSCERMTTLTALEFHRNPRLR